MTPDRRNLLRLANSPSLGASFKFKLLINRMLFVTAGTGRCRTTSLSTSDIIINFKQRVTPFSNRTENSCASSEKRKLQRTCDNTRRLRIILLS